MYQSFSRFIELSGQRCLISIFKVVGAVLNVLFQDQILGVFSAPPATATFPRTCYDRLVKIRATLHDAFFYFLIFFQSDCMSFGVHSLAKNVRNLSCVEPKYCTGKMQLPNLEYRTGSGGSTWLSFPYPRGFLTVFFQCFFTILHY